MARFGQPEDVAKAALFLASDESAYITGAGLNIDGGMSVAR
jgi:NAD(P)-dependent dehydrogenase (short-subunit alcohol dehydrogenase family)